MVCWLFSYPLTSAMRCSNGCLINHHIDCPF